jgi:hypothetical protein
MLIATILLWFVWKGSYSRREEKKINIENTIKAIIIN